MKPPHDVSKIIPEFLHQQLWNATIRASLSRAETVYTSLSTKGEKDAFKQELFTFTSQLIDQEYQIPTPSETKHSENIQKLISFTRKFSATLAGGRLNFGRAQKVLNLFLKYRWCIKTAATPPHFPVDRLIQQKLGIKSPPSWTAWKDESEYNEVIELAKRKALEEGFETIAEYELWLYNTE